MLLENKKNKDSLLYIFILFILVFVLELIFFRNMIFNSDNIVGDLGDARLVSLIMEHWYNVFFNNAPLRDLSMFYPVKNTMGYSDTVFLLSIPYSFFRLIGKDWLTAYQLTIISIHFFGGLCLAWFLRKNLKLPLFACFIGLIIGYFNISYFLKISHVQFLTFSFIPLLFILIKYFYDNIIYNIKRKRIKYGILSIFLFSGILITSFYIGFYMAFFFIIFNIILGIIYFSNNNIKINNLKNIIFTNKIEIIIYFLCLIISLLPIIYIYLPVYNDMGSRNYSEINEYLPYLYNYINLQSLDKLFTLKSFNFELKYGYPVFTMIILIICLIYFIRIYNKSKSNNVVNSIGICFSITIIIISILMLKINLFGKDLSLWYFVYNLFPGASVVRAVFRFNQFLFLPAGIIIAVYLSNKITIPAKELSVKTNYFNYTLIFIVLSTILFVDNQTDIKNTHWSKSEMNNYLDRVTPPPIDCESFLLINNSRDVFYIYHLDAWSIATKYNIKTINGYSGQLPNDWSYMFDMEKNKNYLDAERWIKKNNLNNVYIYDYIKNIWMEFKKENLFDNFSNYSIGENITFRSNRSKFQIGGWSSSEEWGTWTEGEETIIAMNIENENDLSLILNIEMIFNNNPVNIYINDELLDEKVFTIGENIIYIQKEKIINNKLVIKMIFNNLESPFDRGLSNDNRKLGIGVESFYIIENNNE